MSVIFTNFIILTLTFDLDLWPLTLTFDLDLLNQKSILKTISLPFQRTQKHISVIKKLDLATLKQNVKIEFLSSHTQSVSA